YGVDMGILLPSFIGTHSSEYAAMCKRNPTRFRTCAVETELRLACNKGKDTWTIEKALKEHEGYFTGPDKEWFVGIGEFAPGSMGVVRDRPTKQERFREWCMIAEFCIAFDIPCYTHEFTSYCMEEHLTMIANVCTKYPAFKVIIAHGGGSAEDDIKKAVSLARNFENIYLETGYWRAEYYEHALIDPDLGAAKLLWGGGDTGSHIWYPQIRKGAVRSEKTLVYNNRSNWIWSNQKSVTYQPDFLGWATHQITRLKDLDLCTQDEINLIVGGNAARLYKLPVPANCTFASNRPDLNIMPQEILDDPCPTKRAQFLWPEGVDYVSGAHTII
ncbi:MAG: amidohydrolase family protein, partial [Oscillospiraceae bacterium]|nr:amidohydrolase family protein [Oscillospiraceae bacterium]